MQIRQAKIVFGTDRLQHDMDRATTSNTKLEGKVVSVIAVIGQHHRATGQHGLAGIADNVGLKTAATQQAELLSVPVNQHHGPGLAIGRSFGAVNRAQHPFGAVAVFLPGRQHGGKLVIHQSHALSIKGELPGEPGKGKKFGPPGSDAGNADDTLDEIETGLGHGKIKDPFAGLGKDGVGNSRTGGGNARFANTGWCIVR